MRKIDLILIFAILTAIALVVCGCQEEQRVWGQGETPAAYQELFGNSNAARLDYKQSTVIDQLTAVVYGVSSTDSAGKTVRKRGLVERVMALEDAKDLQLQVSKVETSPDIDARMLQIIELALIDAKQLGEVIILVQGMEERLAALEIAEKYLDKHIGIDPNGRAPD